MMISVLSMCKKCGRTSEVVDFDVTGCPFCDVKAKIWRDDDINLYTCPLAFKQLHEKFIERKEVHTCALIMKDLWENHALFYYLATAPYLEIGLHGWEHKDYSLLSYEECFEDLKKSLDYWKENAKRMVGYAKPIDTFFAPWNHEGENIKKACKDLGLNFCNVRKGEWNGAKVNSFHHWFAEMFSDFKIEKLIK